MATARKRIRTASKRAVITEDAATGLRTAPMVTSRGVKITILPSPPGLIDGIRLATLAELEALGGLKLKRPTYKTIIEATGEEQEHEHDESTLESDQDKAAWKAWKDQEQEVETQINLRMLDALLIECVEVDVPKNWKARAKQLHLPDVTKDADGTPFDPEEAAINLKVQYMKCSAISGQDIFDLMVLSSQLAEPDPEALAAARESFQGDVPQAANGAADPVGGPDHEAGAVGA